MQSHHCQRTCSVQVDCLVTTAGGIEEDFIKCLGPTYMGDFSLLGRELRMKGINRIGNLLVPNTNYCLFEDWLTPILDTLLLEQREQVGTKLGFIFFFIHYHFLLFFSLKFLLADSQPISIKFIFILPTLTFICFVI